MIEKMVLSWRAFVRSIYHFYDIEYKIKRMREQFPSSAFEPGAYTYGRCSVGEGAVVGSNAILSDSVVESKTVIGGGSQISGSTIGSKVAIGSGSRISGTKVGDRVAAGSDSFFSNSTISSDAVLGDSVTLDSTSIGERTRVAKGAFIVNSQIAGNSVILDHTTLASVSMKGRSYAAAGSELQFCDVGAFCSIGPEAKIGMGLHPSREYVSTYPAFFRKHNYGCVESFVNEDLFEEIKEIKIGSDVWIGARAMVLDGVKIGNGAIVGAGSLVNKDVPDYAVVVGVPARVIRFRFEPEDIEFLLKLAWWNRDASWIAGHARDFSNIEALKKKLKAAEMPVGR